QWCAATATSARARRRASVARGRGLWLPRSIRSAHSRRRWRAIRSDDGRGRFTARCLYHRDRQRRGVITIDHIPHMKDLREALLNYSWDEVKPQVDEVIRKNCRIYGLCSGEIPHGGRAMDNAERWGGTTVKFRCQFPVVTGWGARKFPAGPSRKRQHKMGNKL